MSNVKSSYEWQNFCFPGFYIRGHPKLPSLEASHKMYLFSKFPFQSRADPELDFGVGELNFLLHVKSFLPLLFPIWNIAVWGGHNLQPPFGSAPVAIISKALKHCLRNNREQFLCCFPCNKFQFPPDPFIMPTVRPTI